MPLDLTSSTDEKIHIHLAPVTSTGKPASLDGVPTWSITSGGATVTPDADGMGAFVISEDVTGSSTWSVSADVNLDPNTVDTISDGGVYTYTHPNASSLGITADAPEAKP